MLSHKNENRIIQPRNGSVMRLYRCQKDFLVFEKEITQDISDSPSVFRFRGKAAKLRAAPAKENAPAKELKSSAQRAD